jgi:tetratricopeptide (TPR) repeat protein
MGCGSRPRRKADEARGAAAAPGAAGAATAAAAAAAAAAAGDGEPTGAVVHEGWIRKLSRKGVLGGRAWRRRWAVIGDDGTLRVFKTQASEKPTKSVNLGEDLVARQLYAEDESAMAQRGVDTTDGSDLAFIFELVLRKNGRALLFACETELELEGWIEVIETEHESRAAGGATPGRRDRFDSAVLRDLGCNPGASHNSWNDRLQAVLDLPSGQNKLLGIATVASDFVGEATKFVAVIVDEYVVPRPLQKFPPLMHTDLGHHGYERDEQARSIYFENDVLYQVLNAPSASVALQTKRDYVSTDKLSVTAALQAQLGAQLLRRAENSVAKKLRTALTVVVSHAGFRVSATAVLPVSPGTLAYGVGCAEPDERLCSLIDRAMSQHGFGSHPVGRQLLLPDGGEDSDGDDGGEMGESSCQISTGIDVAGHRGEDGRYYLTNLEGICPADLLPVSDNSSEISSEDAGKAAKTALGTRFLRPELVARYTRETGEALSSNSFLSLCETNQEDRLVNEEFEWAATRASRFLRENVITELMEQLNRVEMLPCSGAALTVAMHRAGINMRFLGLLAARATLPHVHDLLVVEMVGRQAKQLLSQNLLRQQLGAGVRLHGDGLAKTTVELWLREQEMERRETVTDFFNLLLGETQASVSYWANVIVPAVRRAYGVDVERCEVRRVALACALQMSCGVELRAAEHASAAWRKDFVRPTSGADASAAACSLGMLGILPLACELEPEIDGAGGGAGGVEAAAGEDGDEGAGDSAGLLTDGDFGRWSGVLHQPWVSVPYTFQHQLLSEGDLRAAVIRPRRLCTQHSLPGGASDDACAAAGTAYSRKCLGWVGEGASASLRKTFAACSRCLRREAQLRLAGDLALAAASSGHFEEALSLIEEVEVRLLRGGWEDAEVGRLMLVIGHIHRVHQNADAARQYCSRGLQAVTASWGPHHPLLLELHGLMAQIDLDSGDPHSCLAHRQACLKVASTALGLQHVATACYANAVGLDCLRLAAGEASEAVGHHQRALAVYENTYGRSHAGTAACAYYLAAALWRAGDYEQAAETASYAAEVRKNLAAAAATADAGGAKTDGRAEDEDEDEEGSTLLLLMESLAQIAEVADARGDFAAASTALQELMALPAATSAHAQAAVETAAAATLRVCLRTQISFELAAALQQPSTAVATLFRQAFAARGQSEDERTESAQRQMQKIEKVAVRTARKLCLQQQQQPPPPPPPPPSSSSSSSSSTSSSSTPSSSSSGGVGGGEGGANDYVMKLRAQIASGGNAPGTPGKDLSNVLGATPTRGGIGNGGGRGTPARPQTTASRHALSSSSSRQAGSGSSSSVQSSPAVSAGGGGGDARSARKRQLQAVLTAELELGAENGIFFEFSLCLSRACLGKMMHFNV